MSNENVNIFAPGFQFSSEIKNDSNKFLWVDWASTGLAMASDDGGGFYLWQKEKAKLEYRWCGAFAGVSIVAWSPDDSAIAAGCLDGTIQLQACDQREILLQVDIGYAGPSVRALKWLSDGSAFISSYAGGDIRVWSAKTGEVLKRFHYNSNPPYHFPIALSPDDKLLAVGGLSTPIEIWDSESGKLEQKLDGHWGPPCCLDWSPDGNLLLAGSLDSTIYVWDIQTGKLVQELSEAQKEIRYARFSPDGRLLAATSDDNIIRIWRCDDWKQLVQMPELSGSVTGGLIFHPTEPKIAIGSRDGHAIKLWEYDIHKMQR